MKIRILLSLVILSILTIGCRKDDIVESSTNPVIPDPTIELTAGIEGLVYNENGVPLAGVEVLNENGSTVTDQNGYFKFESELLLESGSYMTFKQNGFFEGYKFVNPSLNRTGYVEVMMVEKGLPTMISASTGGVVPVNGGAKVSLPANGIIDASGNAYNGDVNVYTFWYDPLGNQITQLMPGDLRAINESSQFVQLQTFGMMAVELESAAGEKLNLAEGSKATLEFPVDPSLNSSAPQEIPLWYFNELTGYWMEEGAAQLADGKYTGTVSHFSFWNCDAPFPLVKLSGRILDQNGNPVKQASICITVTTNGLTGYGWTDSEGYYCGKVPKGKTLAMQVKDNCGNVVYEEAPIGPLDSNFDMGEITINFDYGSRIHGVLVCNGVPVSNGYVVVSSQFGYQIFDADENGKFSGTFINCGDTDLSVQGFNADDLTSGDEFFISITPGQDLGLDDLEVCTNVLDEYLKYTIKENGDETLKVIRDIDAYFSGDKLVITTAGPDSIDYFTWTVQNPIEGVQDVFSAEFVWEYDGIEWFFGCSPNQDCSALLFELTNFEIVEGSYVEGTFMLTSFASRFDLCGEFRVKLDDVFTADASINGLVWHDEDRNGQRENSEELLEGVEMKIFQGSTFDLLATTLTNADGYYEFTDLLEGTYVLTVSRDGWSPTLLTVGDPATDNDFEPWSDRGETYIQNGSTQTAFDAGIAEDIENNIIGRVWEDTNEDGKFDANEVPLPDIQVQLLVGQERFETFTDGDGNYLFTGVFLGDAYIAFNAPDYQLADNNEPLEANFQGFTAGMFFGIGPGDQIDIACGLVMSTATALECGQDITYETCQGSPITVEAEATGGIPPYTFDWGFGPTDFQFYTFTSPGSYVVVVTDANGEECSFVVDIIESTLAWINHNVTSATCGQSNGSIVDPNAWSTGLTFEWFDENGNSISTEPNLEDLAPGTYNLLIQDFNVCEDYRTYVVSNQQASIGDYVWLDSGSTPNVLDADDQGFGNILIKLYDANMGFIDSTRSSSISQDTLGFYNFIGDFTGEYYIEVELPAGYEFVEPMQGMNNNLDSDIIPAEGRSNWFNLPDCKSDYRIDIGIKEQ